MGLRERWSRHRGTRAPEPAPDHDGAADGLDADFLPEQVYHDAALAFLTAQIGSSDALDTKASQALTVGSAALPLTIALVVLRATPERPHRSSPWTGRLGCCSFWRSSST